MHPKPQNPFGDKMQEWLIEGLEEAENDDSVNSILLTGGLDRSFCVGGDFSEIIDMNTSFNKVSAFLGQICELYIKVLRVTKPIVSAVDHYAIGLGFQLVLLTDYRIGSDRAKFKMPEVRNGVACTLGGILLEQLVNRFEMMRICYEGDVLPIDYVKSIGILNEICTPEKLIDRAFEKAKEYGSFPSIPFRNTKKVNNDRLIKAIEDTTMGTILAHYYTFSGNVHKPYMRKILKQNE
jgi:carboxymethylproline synthase